MRKSLFLSAAFMAVSAPVVAQNIETVVVTASPLVDRADRFANIVGSIDRREILKQGGTSVADALGGVPGVTSSGFAPGSGRPVIRGFNSTRVRILENGVGSFDVSDIGPDHGVPIDPLSAQAIEIVRGPATLRYGSQAIGGVVNVINNRIPRARNEKPWAFEGNALYGSNAETGQGSLLADFQAGDTAIHADGYVRRTGDYDTPLGVMPNSFFRGDGFSLGASQFFGDESRVGATFIRNAASYGIPNEGAYIAMRQFKGQFGASLALDQGSLETLNIDAGYADYRHHEMDPGVGPESTFQDREWDARAEAIFGDIGVFDAAAFGLQIQSRDFSALGHGADYMNPSKIRSYAMFGFSETALSEELELQLGARLEQMVAKGTPITGIQTERSFMPFSASAGLVYKPSETLTLGLSISSAARAPAPTELYAIGPHEGSQTYETGDPTLKIERANSIEASVHVNNDIWHVEASVWGSRFDNFIYADLTGGSCDEDGNCVVDDSEELREVFYRQRGAQFWGMEAKATASVFKIDTSRIEAFVKGDYVRASFGSGGGNVPRITPWHLGGGLDLKGVIFDAGLALTYTGAQNDISGGETPTDGFVSLDLSMAVRPFKEYPGAEFAFVAKNLTDEIQRNHIAFNKDSVVLPGRDLRLMFRMAL